MSWPMSLSRIVKSLRAVFSDIGSSQRNQVASLTVLELRELENIFALLLLGSFAGFPSPPSFISMELLPFLEKELEVLNDRAEDAGDMLAELAGSIGIDA